MDRSLVLINGKSFGAHGEPGYIVKFAGVEAHEWISCKDLVAEGLDADGEHRRDFESCFKHKLEDVFAGDEGSEFNDHSIPAEIKDASPSRESAESEKSADSPVRFGIYKYVQDRSGSPSEEEEMTDLGGFLVSDATPNESTTPDKDKEISKLDKKLKKMKKKRDRERLERKRKRMEELFGEDSD